MVDGTDGRLSPSLSPGKRREGEGSEENYQARAEEGGRFCLARPNSQSRTRKGKGDKEDWQAYHQLIRTLLNMMTMDRPQRSISIKEVPVGMYVLYVCMYSHTYSKGKDQPGKVANPARDQLSREN